MTRTARWITFISAVVIGLALTILIGAWCLGLLPLLFPHPAPIATVQTAIQNNDPAPVATYQQQPSKTATGTAQSPSAFGKTTLSSAGNAAGLQKNSAQPTKDQLQKQIDDYYTAKLQSLGKSYESQLNGLVSEAFSEYQSDKKQGKDISVAAMAFRYMCPRAAPWRSSAIHSFTPFWTSMRQTSEITTCSWIQPSRPNRNTSPPKSTVKKNFSAPRLK